MLMTNLARDDLLAVAGPTPLWGGSGFGISKGGDIMEVTEWNDCDIVEEEQDPDITVLSPEEEAERDAYFASPAYLARAALLYLPEEEKKEFQYNRDHWIATYPCKNCGCCPTPGKCVRSVECPTCRSVAGSFCIDPNRPENIASYHEGRWQTARSEHGTYYK